MFEAACAPKEQPEVAPDEPSSSHAHSNATRTPTGTSSSQTEDHLADGSRTPTASEGPSFQGFEYDGGPITSTPVAPPSRKVRDNIFKKAESSASSVSESPHEQLRREVANFHIDSSSLDITETSTSHIPASMANLSISSLSSVQSLKEPSNVSANKEKGRTQPLDLRTKALQNTVFQKAKGPIFTERPSTSSFTSNDVSLKEEPKPKPVSIFSANPQTTAATSGAPRTFLPVFNRMQQQIFAPPPGAAATTAQQRMLKQLLQEAEEEKRAGIAAGSPTPARSPARLNAVRQMMSTAHSISLSTDNDTDYSTRHNDPTNGYANEGVGVRNYELDDYFDDSDEDMGDDMYSQGQSGHVPAVSQTYDMEEDQSFDSTGWQPRENPDTNTIGTTNDTLFGLGNRRPGGREFELQDALRRNEPDSFAIETPIRPRP